MSIWISTAKHRLARDVVRLRDDKAFRYQSRRILVEGKKTIRDLVSTGLRPKLILSASPSEELFQNQDLSRADTYHLITEDVLRSISSTESPDNVLAVFNFPDWVQSNFSQQQQQQQATVVATTPNLAKPRASVRTPDEHSQSYSIPSSSDDTSVFNGQRFLIGIDGIQDPGNVGALFRTALAFGWQGVFLVP